MFPETCDTGLQSIAHDGVLLGALGPWDPDEHFPAWQIGTAAGRIDAVIASRELADRLAGVDMQPHRFDLACWDEGAAPWPILTAATPLPNARAIAYLPADFCPLPGVLDAARSLVDAIDTDPLRDFVHAVFAERTTCQRFWTMPASIRHHHAYPGGLAQHSVEVAADLADHGRLSVTERDLGIAAGLLHDIGKVWAYTGDMFPSAEGLAMGHELAGLMRLAPRLQELGRAWPDGGYAMQVLLSGCALRNPTMPATQSNRCRPPPEGRDAGSVDYGWTASGAVKFGAWRLRTESPLRVSR